MWQIKLDGNCLLVCKNGKVMLRLYPEFRFDVISDDCGCRVCISGINAKGENKSLLLNSHSLSSVFSTDVTGLSCYDIFDLLKDIYSEQGGGNSRVQDMGKYCKDDKEYIIAVVMNLDNTIDYYMVQSTDGSESLQMDDISEYTYCEDITNNIKRPNQIFQSQHKETCIFHNIQQWVSGNGAICYTLVGDNPNENPMTIINQNDYDMANKNRLGALRSFSNDFATKEGKSFDICAGTSGRTLTLADILTQTSADITQLMTDCPPDTGYEWNLVGLRLLQHPAKKMVHCTLTNAYQTVGSEEQLTFAFDGDGGEVITVGDDVTEVMKPLGKPNACGCLTDRNKLITDADFTTPITMPANTALYGCPVYACVVSAP